MDVEIFESAKKTLRIQKYPDTRTSERVAKRHKLSMAMSFSLPALQRIPACSLSTLQAGY